MDTCQSTIQAQRFAQHVSIEAEEEIKKIKSEKQFQDSEIMLPNGEETIISFYRPLHTNASPRVHFLVMETYWSVG